MSLPEGLKSGLVYSVTTDKRDRQYITVDAQQKRLGRMKKAVKTGGRLHVEDLQRGGFRFKALLITTTYRPEAEWCAGDVSTLLKHLREWCRRRAIEFRYQWVLELTKAGRPHYHVMMFVPRGLMVPKPDKQGWWAHGMTNVVATVRNAAGYLSKYASKGTTTRGMPSGARLHGGGGLGAESRLERAWWMLPLWVRESFSQVDRAVKVPGGWLSRASGELIASPWAIIARDPEWKWVRLEKLFPGEQIERGVA